jgi:hypothetical protein
MYVGPHLIRVTLLASSYDFKSGCRIFGIIYAYVQKNSLLTHVFYTFFIA